MREGQRGRPAGTTVVGSEAGARGREENLESCGRVCVTLPGSLRMGRCRLDLAPITSVTAERGGYFVATTDRKSVATK